MTAPLGWTDCAESLSLADVRCARDGGLFSLFPAGAALPRERLALQQACFRRLNSFLPSVGADCDLPPHDEIRRRLRALRGKAQVTLRLTRLPIDRTTNASSGRDYLDQKRREVARQEAWPTMAINLLRRLIDGVDRIDQVATTTEGAGTLDLLTPTTEVPVLEATLAANLKRMKPEENLHLAVSGPWVPLKFVDRRLDFDA